MNREIKDIMKKLGEAINATIQDSADIQKLLQELEAKGYTISLSLAVVVGLGNPEHPKKKMRRFSRDPAEEGTELRPTAFDRKFLKALRIKISEEQT